MANSNEPRNKQQVGRVMEEVGQELGVDEQEQRSPGKAEKLAEKVKREIQERK